MNEASTTDLVCFRKALDGLTQLATVNTSSTATLPTGGGEKQNHIDSHTTHSSVVKHFNEEILDHVRCLNRTFTAAVKSEELVSEITYSRGFRALCHQLLSNDSLLDISRSMSIYQEMFDLLLQIARQPETAEFFTHPVTFCGSQNQSTCKQLLVALEAQAKVFLQLHRGKQVIPAKGYSDVAILETDESVLMANTIIDTVKAVDSFSSDTTVKSDTNMAAGTSCTKGNGASSSGAGAVRRTDEVLLEDRDIVFRHDLKRRGSDDYDHGANSYHRSATPSKHHKRAYIAPPSPMEVLGSERAAYAMLMHPHRFAVMDMCCLISSGRMSHEYHTEVTSRRTSASSDPKQRMTRIAKEMATLSTTLPVEFGSSVFLRVDESRMDLIKALIVGPLGTPYANGCFEFDILLPSDYPHRPPYVTLVTTGRGTVSFHPFFSEDGYICLSLFNTSDGPGVDWNAQHSTLLQVLVSIQSLVMVAEPYHTDPATPRCMDKSDRYNKNIMHQCMRWAIWEQIKSPSVVFQDAIRAHFRNKRLSLKQQLQEWLLEVPQCKALVHSIDQALDQL